MSPLSSDELAVIILSLQVAVCGVAIMLAPAVGVAWVLARKQFWGKSLLDGLVHVPLVLPPVAVGYGLLLLLGRNSTIGGRLHAAGIDLAFTWKAAAIAAGVMAFPLMVRSIRLAMELVDRRIEQAAATLGAAPARVFCRVTLPLAAPGIAAGVILGFAKSLGEFGATITFAGNIKGTTRTIPSAIYSYSQTPGGDSPALRLMAISLAISLLALVGSQFVSRRIDRWVGIAA